MPKRREPSPLIVMLLALGLAAPASGCLERAGGGDDDDDSAPDDDDDTGGDDDDDDDTGADDDDTGPAGCGEEVAPGWVTTVDSSCMNEVQAGAFGAVVEWTWDSFAVAPTFNNVMMTPIVISLNDDNGDGVANEDDIPDIVFISYSGSNWTGVGVLRALSGDGSGILWSLPDLNVQAGGNIAAADIDGDGFVEIVAPTTSHQIQMVNHDGTPGWLSGAITSPSCASQFAWGPAISDMDSDGSPEVVVGATILNFDGSQRGQGAQGCALGLSFAVDVDLDGIQEVVTGNALYAPDGSTIWSIPAADGYTAVGNFDQDDAAEIVVVTGSEVRLLDGIDGGLIWSYPTSAAGPPTIADYDGDGLPEIGVAGTSEYVVIDTDGTLLWSVISQDGSSGRTGSAVYDFEGDGVAEVVYADEYTVWVLSGVDGSVRLSDPNHLSWTWLEYATIADVDGDNHAEIIVPNGEYSGNPVDALYGITVLGDSLDQWQSGRPIWNQHAYHITNIQDDGSVPIVASPPWGRLNSFRSGDLTAGNGLLASDLVLEVGSVCEDNCAAGELGFTVHAGNEGAVLALAGATLQPVVYISAGGIPLEPVVLDVLHAGAFIDGIYFEVDDPAIPSIADITEIRVFITGVEPECIEDNNVLSIPGPFCD